ncbi:hypothetical protein AB0D57_31960 [Streptomyces sp. NPDC048275]|uniref:hypothetical protein n=1 Tax=Streptomyces sp. NPDC048275 TaxID=3155629 RepID=UPI00340178D2
MRARRRPGRCWLCRSGGPGAAQDMVGGVGEGGLVCLAVAALATRWAAEDIQAVAATLNSRPRKSLGWKTPAEALNDHLLSIT